MNFQLLWMDALIVALLWIAMTSALVSRLKVRWVRGGLAWGSALIPVILLGVNVVVAVGFKFYMKIEPNWFAYTLSLFLAFLAGGAWVLRRGWRHEAGMPPAAASWRPGPLAAAWMIAAAVWYMTLLNMDLANRARLAILSVEANSIYLASLPAQTSEAQNAAPLYEKAFARLDADLPTDIQNDPIGNSLKFDPNEPATIAFLQREAATITLLHRAGELTGCRFDQDLPGPDMGMILSGLNGTRFAANVLMLHAREEIAHGHAGNAIEDARAILVLSRRIEERPTMVSAMVGIGIADIGHRTLAEALPAVKSRDELAGLRMDELPSLGRTYQESMRGEERYGLRLMGNMGSWVMKPVNGQMTEVQDTGLLSSAGSGSGLGGAYFRVFYLDADAYVDLYEQIQGFAVQPYFQVRDPLAEMTNAKTPHGVFTSILVPSLAKSLETLAKVEAGEACARAGVAMTQYRLDHGAYPGRLEELVPAYLEEVPVDPFDGHPIRLAIRDGQLIIYSIGSDGVDDGGVDIDPITGKGDVIFTLKPPRAVAATRP
jgi:hypothetical protein